LQAVITGFYLDTETPLEQRKVRDPQLLKLPSSNQKSYQLENVQKQTKLDKTFKAECNFPSIK
jgi:hypothetical protein